MSFQNEKKSITLFLVVFFLKYILYSYTRIYNNNYALENIILHYEDAWSKYNKRKLLLIIPSELGKGNESITSGSIVTAVTF